MKEEYRSIRLEQIKKIVTNNGRNIADNSIRIDMVHDDVKELQEMIEGIEDNILEIREILVSIKEGYAHPLDKVM